MKFLEKIKLTHKALKEKIARRKKWRYDFNKLSDYNKELIKKNYSLNKYEKTLKTREEGIINKEELIKNYEDIENYIPGFWLFNWFKKKFYKNVIVVIIITKVRGLRIMFKPVKDGTIKDDKKEYKINPEFMLKGKKFFIALFLENKLEQLNPDYVDHCPISATNFALIFDDTLIQKVFSPREKPESPIKWLIILVVGIVVLLLILHFSGVIDLKEIFSGIVSTANNSTAPPKTE